ncbi:MAG: 50S ribosomal protein L29 [Planctomycetota bacterium]|jgi:large subunit ribosomal protein L29|nr:50S ribosomal protein L29 [Planctomycetota bacterium]
MKKSEIQDLRTKSIEELETSLQAHREELMRGRFDQVTKGEGIGVRARSLRRNVARLQTIIAEKKGEAAKA